MAVAARTVGGSTSSGRRSVGLGWVVATYGLLIFFLLWTVIPFLWMFLASIKTNKEIYNPEFTIFPKQVKEYEERFGIRFLGWYNVAHGWDFDNVILLDLPDYATLDKLEADEATRALGHRAGEWIFERHHSMFLRERMGPDLEYHP